MFRFISRFLKKQIREARNRWRQGFRSGRVWLTIPVTAMSMYVLWHWSFALGSYFGIAFLTAATLAIVRGHIFTHPFRMLLVVVAVVIGTLVIPALGGDAWQAFRRGDTLTAVVLMGLVLLSWLLKRQLETGRMRFIRIRLPKRRRRPRRK